MQAQIVVCYSDNLAWRRPWEVTELSKTLSKLTEANAVISDKWQYQHYGIVEDCLNIVISSVTLKRQDLLITAPNYEYAMTLAESSGFDYPLIIGGTFVFQQALSDSNRVNKAHIFHYPKYLKSDTFFPIDLRESTSGWKQIRYQIIGSIKYCTYQRLAEIKHPELVPATAV